MLFWKFERPVWPPTAKMCWISACNTAKWQQPLLYCDLLRLSHMTERFVFSREQVWGQRSIARHALLPFFLCVWCLGCAMVCTKVPYFFRPFMSSFFQTLTFFSTFVYNTVHLWAHFLKLKLFSKLYLMSSFFQTLTFFQSYIYEFIYSNFNFFLNICIQHRPFMSSFSQT